MRDAVLTAAIFLLCVAAAWAEMGFDPRYERDYNIFNPINKKYAPDNPLNPANVYAPDNPFNPMNRYDPGNPANPMNQYSPNNPFNPANRYHPENPLNPANRFNPAVPFASLDGGWRNERAEQAIVMDQGRTVKPRPRKSASKVKHGT